MKQFSGTRFSVLIVFCLSLGMVPASNADIAPTERTVTVRFETYPADPMVNDTFMISPVWYSFHDGTFDIFDVGQLAGPAVADFARSWNNFEGLHARFSEEQPEGVFGRIKNIDWQTGGPSGLDPSNEFSVRLNPSEHRFFSFLGRLMPSDDGIVGNDDPHSLELFDGKGRWKGPKVIDVYGTEVLDAGVQLNDETDIQFLDFPGQGIVTEERPINYHPGYNGSQGNPDGTPVNVLGGQYTYQGGASEFVVTYDQATTDFTQANFRIMRIRISTPEADGSYTGSWYNPDRNGEGFSIHVIDRKNPRVVVYWFTYEPDGSGQQVWLLGVDELLDGDQTYTMHRYTGGTFGSTGNPESVMGETVGTLELDFHSCKEASVMFEPEVGSAFPAVSYPIERLAAPSIGLEDACP